MTLLPRYVDGAASDEADAALAMLQGSIPGVPGEDYPIYAEVPETAFSCDGQVDGGNSMQLLVAAGALQHENFPLRDGMLVLQIFIEILCL